MDPPFSDRRGAALKLVAQGASSQKSPHFLTDGLGSRDFGLIRDSEGMPESGLLSAAAGLERPSLTAMRRLMGSASRPEDARDEIPKEGGTYTSDTMTSPGREELALQFQNARLQVDRDLLAAKQAEVEFRSDIKVMIAQQGEAFQTLRSDINKAVGEANLNVERLRSEMHREASVNLRWIVTTMLAIGVATAGAVSWVVKTGVDSRMVQATPTAVPASVAASEPAVAARPQATPASPR